jgi:hypothetical protein
MGHDTGAQRRAVSVTCEGRFAIYGAGNLT